LRLLHKSIAIADRSSIGEARRSAIHSADALGFSQERRSDIGIVATEIATNVLLHAQRGEVLVCPSQDKEAGCLDLLGVDSGAGISDIGRAMEDGFSTVGTAGQGLGAIHRLSDDASLYSAPTKGTVQWARFVVRSTIPAQAFGLVSIPVHGETQCGDGFFAEIGSSQSLYMVVDGLGHGPGAAEAAEEAIATVRKLSREPLLEIFLRSHDALKKTRGAAMSVVLIDHDRLTATYAGVGNISATLITGSNSRSLVSQNGTLGAVIPRAVQAYSYPIERNTFLLMFSDGLTSKTGVGGYVGLQSRNPMLAAGVLYRDFGRKRDDATVVLAPIGGKSE
jgi:anti-sigma regulatory factor (Ser/Thr protein kinase)